VYVLAQKVDRAAIFALASFRLSRHINRQFPSSLDPERIPAMHSLPKLRVVLPMVLVAAAAVARGSDIDGLSDRKTFVIPRKNSRWQDRASEFVQRYRKLELRDGDKTLVPSGVGYVYRMERRDGERLWLLNRTHSLQGWVLATEVVQLDEAEALFSREIEANPKSPFAHMMRGFVRYENDDPIHALGDVDEALRLDPKCAFAWNFHAFFWQCKNRLDLAMADVNKAIALDPQFSGAFVERGFLHCLQNQFDDALHDFDRAGDLGSRSVQIEFCRGAIDFQHGALEEAEGKFDHVLKIDPNRYDAWLRLAEIKVSKAEPEQALFAFEHAIQADPRFAYSYRQRAVFFLSRFEYDKALADLNEAIKLDPKIGEFYINRLAVWLVRADYGRALADLEIAIGLDPKNADLHVIRGLVLTACPVAGIRNGRQAVASATRACELTQWKDPESLGLLAAAKSETGDFDAAVRWQMKAIEYLDLGDPGEKGYRDILECYDAKKPYHSVGRFMEMGLRADVKRP
jgi:tetratricopeptide (TPR) repeat protein